MPIEIPFRTDSLTKRVQAYIKQCIVETRRAGGDALPAEGEICQTLGVSRTAVREAVKALEALGIVEVRHGAGLYIRPFNLDATRDNLAYSLDADPQTIAELAQVREWLDVGAVPHVVARIDDATIAQLETTLQQWEDSVAERDHAQEDASFHSALARVTGNRLLVLLIDTYWEILGGTPYQALRSPSDSRANLENHKRILRALKARDIAAAQAAVSASYADQRDRAARAIPVGGAAPDRMR